VRLTGSSPLHDAYHQAARSLEGDLRSIALQTGRGRVWFEQLRIRTKKRAAASSSNGFTLGPDADGPYASLHHVMQQMRTDPRVRGEVAALLKPLWDKLPGELVGDRLEPLRVDCPDTIGGWIEDAEPELVQRLQTEDGAA